MGDPAWRCTKRLQDLIVTSAPNLYAIYLAEARDKFNERMEAKNDGDETTLEDFEIEGLIGEGYYGKVYKAKHKGRKSCALKVQPDRPMSAKEKEKTLAFDSIFIVKALFAFRLDETKVCLALEFASYGDLKQNSEIIRDFASEELVKLITAQIVLAFEYMHTCLYTHGDFRLDNVVMFENGYIKLCDLGHCNPIFEAPYVFAGRIQDMPPEKRTQQLNAIASEWYDLGTAINPLVPEGPSDTADSEAEGSDSNDSMLGIRFAQYPSMGFGDTCADFLEKLHEQDATRRIGAMARGANDVKDHAWLKSVNFFDLYNQRIPIEEKLPPNLKRPEIRPGRP